MTHPADSPDGGHRGEEDDGEGQHEAEYKEEGAVALVLWLLPRGGAAEHV